MSARDALFADIWDMRSAEEKNRLIDAHREEVALEIGRDALRDGLLPALARLVGEANATKLMADYRDAHARELAERVRNQRHEGHDQIKCVPCFIYGHAADLIDPHKDATCSQG